ncbi:hypothetical protein JQ559_30935 [Bradyrhizobium viridifuturi]|jgi:hypothetical protein|uniref:hypothetical protein n=1 Tax=Bradyrhizobium TaxID=374 RepID=UPI00039841EE|nr:MULTISPECIES: hypothetical protein [Bradyrhizobium]ERF79801.1 MAG: hypothetical protein C207_07000 [Bradyrhizobium sp. DFCI-1]OYU58183.1 MAG: hypothetical protein CFE30_32285 [Bradyrhizobium sp. PARBB1]PSO27598.1 hypothetical protein C7G43_06345 [Bradyrhizobium sp. MOS004]QRI69403.1 hypothetical protein JQ507_31835 [Bradyrhizobium sp. PSBB068]MBR1022392.1 hypothetical protein [Bradyrhizobium viridifuturi]
MENAAADSVAVCLDEDSDPYRLIVTDLVALIGHVQASLRLIEAAIAREAFLAEQDAAANVFVLDDVTPRYAAASTALKACDTGLGMALDRLREPDAPARFLN